MILRITPLLFSYGNTHRSALSFSVRQFQAALSSDNNNAEVVWQTTKDSQPKVYLITFILSCLTQPMLKKKNSNYSFIDDTNFLGHTKLFQIVAAYGPLKTLVDK